MRTHLNPSPKLQAASARSDEEPFPEGGWALRSAYWNGKLKAKAAQQNRALRDRREPLILSGHGIKLRVDRGTLLVQNGFTHYPQQREEWRLFPGDWRLPSRIVILDGTGGLSIDAVAWLAEHDVPLVRIDWQGSVVHVTGGNGAIDQKLRDAQIAAIDNGRGLALSRRLISEKIENSMTTLGTAFPRSPAIELALKRIVRDAELMRTNPPSTVPDLLGVEGRVAYAYFSAWQSFPLSWKGIDRHPIPEDWKRIGARKSMVSSRSHGNQHATHPVNAMLNYAYGVLEHRVRTEVVGVGFDPTIGYFHGRFRDKAALVYDLMEPLRPHTDKLALHFVCSHTFHPSDVIMSRDGTCRLSPELGRALANSMIDIDQVSAAVKLAVSDVL